MSLIANTTQYVVPDLNEMINCSFYWGKIDIDEATKLLEGKPEGTFLLRDSVQENNLFTLSFKDKESSGNVRIEQYDNLFSLSLPSPQVSQSPTVTGLFKDYTTNPCLWYDVKITMPLQRNFPFDLKQLSRAAIRNYINNESVNKFPLPHELKIYLMEYDNNQIVRVE